MIRFIIIMGVCASVMAGTGLAQTPYLPSPVVHDDRRVTFRLRAPKAKEVQLRGVIDETVPLEASAEHKGVWEITVGPLVPAIYEYTYAVDGAVVIDPKNRQVKKWRDLGSMVLVPNKETPAQYEWQNVPHGTVHQHRYASRSASNERRVYVYTPPGYSNRSHDSTGYPVLYLLHGFGDDASAWNEVGQMAAIMDNLIAQNACQEMIVVMPNGHPIPIPNGAKFDEYAPKNLALMERDLLEDLRPYIAQHYRVSASRHHNAIAGLSMGGGQALTIGLRHLETFAWVGGFSSAAPEKDRESVLAPLLEDVAVTNDRLRWLWIGCGKKDFLLKRNDDFITWLKETGVKHDYALTEGGHQWSVWRDYLAIFAKGLFK